MPDNQVSEVRQVRLLNRRDILFSVARFPESARLLVASSQGKVLEVDASRTDGQDRELADHGRYVTSVVLAGRTAISGGYDGRLIWWDTEAGRATRTIADAHSRWIRHLALSPDRTILASVADDMVCRLWNVATGEKIRELRGHEARTPTHFNSMLYVCAFSPDGTKLATGDRVGRVNVWNVADGRELARLDASSLYTWDERQRIRSIGGVRALSFSPDGTRLAVGGVGRIGNVDALQGPSRVEVFDWNRREKLFDFQGANGIVNRLIHHPRGHWLCAVGGGSNGLILFHDPQRGTRLHQGNLPMHVHDAAFDEDYRTLYAVGHQKIAVFEVRS